ncbi:hypothetical protein D0Y65_052637 [Glycine soja]|uniref:Uncharacterized protein n=1 Tax=Glycine soja TaxID=3848 RepID=A0A445FM13_GLYSO|nr:hypothetical protein D0Y65_052637 [Glycine soja]
MIHRKACCFLLSSNVSVSLVGLMPFTTLMLLLLLNSHFRFADKEQKVVQLSRLLVWISTAHEHVVLDK